jgi:uncharacterized membrane protein
MVEKESAAPVKKTDDTMMAAAATIPIVGIIIYFGMKDASDYVKHYAKQGIALCIPAALLIIISIVTFVLSFLPVIGTIVSVVSFCFYPLAGLALFALWVFVLINALQGKKYSLPYLTELVDKYVK